MLHTPRKPLNSHNRVLNMKQPRYTITLIMFITLIGCAAASATHYLVRGLSNGDRRSQLVFLLFAVAGPMLLMVIVSVARSLIDRRR
jgi:uncharacterized membrane protein YeaQ/YmgE (transglycosylase-associated protein family)